MDFECYNAKVMYVMYSTDMIIESLDWSTTVSYVMGIPFIY